MEGQVDKISPESKEELISVKGNIGTGSPDLIKSPKKPIILGVVQSSSGGKINMGNVVRKRRWDQPPEEEPQPTESSNIEDKHKTELVKTTKTVSECGEDFDKITISKSSSEIQPTSENPSSSVEVPAKPQRIKLIRPKSNIAKIPEGKSDVSSNLDITENTNITSEKVESNIKISLESTVLDSTNESNKMEKSTADNPTLKSSALLMISSYDDSPSEDSQTELDSYSVEEEINTELGNQNECETLEENDEEIQNKDDIIWNKIEETSPIKTENIVMPESKTLVDLSIEDEMEKMFAPNNLPDKRSEEAISTSSSNKILEEPESISSNFGNCVSIKENIDVEFNSSSLLIDSNESKKEITVEIKSNQDIELKLEKQEEGRLCEESKVSDHELQKTETLNSLRAIKADVEKDQVLSEIVKISTEVNQDLPIIKEDSFKNIVSINELKSIDSKTDTTNNETITNLSESIITSSDEIMEVDNVLIQSEIKTVEDNGRNENMVEINEHLVDSKVGQALSIPTVEVICTDNDKSVIEIDEVVISEEIIQVEPINKIPEIQTKTENNESGLQSIVGDESVKIKETCNENNDGEVGKQDSIKIDSEVNLNEIESHSDKAITNPIKFHDDITDVGKILDTENERTIDNLYDNFVIQNTSNREMLEDEKTKNQLEVDISEQNQDIVDSIVENNDFVNKDEKMLIENKLKIDNMQESNSTENEIGKKDFTKAENQFKLDLLEHSVDTNLSSVEKEVEEMLLENEPIIDDIINCTVQNAEDVRKFNDENEKNKQNLFENKSKPNDELDKNHEGISDNELINKNTLNEILEMNDNDTDGNEENMNKSIVESFNDDTSTEKILGNNICELSEANNIHLDNHKTLDQEKTCDKIMLKEDKVLGNEVDINACDTDLKESGDLKSSSIVEKQTENAENMPISDNLEEIVKYDSKLIDKPVEVISKHSKIILNDVNEKVDSESTINYNLEELVSESCIDLGDNKISISVKDSKLDNVKGSHVEEDDVISGDNENEIELETGISYTVHSDDEDELLSSTVIKKSDSITSLMEDELLEENIKNESTKKDNISLEEDKHNFSVVKNKNVLTNLDGNDETIISDNTNMADNVNLDAKLQTKVLEPITSIENEVLTVSEEIIETETFDVFHLKDNTHEVVNVTEKIGEIMSKDVNQGKSLSTDLNEEKMMDEHENVENEISLEKLDEEERREKKYIVKDLPENINSECVPVKDDQITTDNENVLQTNSILIEEVDVHKDVKIPKLTIKRKLDIDDSVINVKIANTEKFESFIAVKEVPQPITSNKTENVQENIVHIELIDKSAIQPTQSCDNVKGNINKGVKSSKLKLEEQSAREEVSRPFKVLDDQNTAIKIDTKTTDNISLKVGDRIAVKDIEYKPLNVEKNLEIVKKDLQDKEAEHLPLKTKIILKRTETTSDSSSLDSKSVQLGKEMLLKTSTEKYRGITIKPIQPPEATGSLSHKIDANTSSVVLTSTKNIVKQLPQTKLEPITLKLSKDNPVIMRSQSLSPKKSSDNFKAQVSKAQSMSPQSKTLGYTLKIGKDSTQIIPKDTSSVHSGVKTPDISKMEHLFKNSVLTITPITPEQQESQKLSKITLKLSKAGGHPEIKNDDKSETWKTVNKLPEVDIISIGKSANLNQSGSGLKRKEITEGYGFEKKIKLESNHEQGEGSSSKLQGLLTKAFPNVSTSSPIFQMQMQRNEQITMEPRVTTITGPRKRGRPRKIIPPGIHPMSNERFGSPGFTQDSNSEGSMFPVPLFNLSDPLVETDPQHIFPNQVQPSNNRPQRSCRGRIRLPMVRTRRPRGSGILRGVMRGRGRGRGIKQMMAEMLLMGKARSNDHSMTIKQENVQDEVSLIPPDHSFHKSIENFESLNPNKILSPSITSSEISGKFISENTSLSSEIKIKTEPGLERMDVSFTPIKNTNRGRQIRIGKVKRLTIKEKKERKEAKRLKQREKAAAAAAAKLQPPQMFEEETRMSATESNSRAHTPARTAIGENPDESMGSMGDHTSTSTSKNKKGRMEVIDLESGKELTVDQIAEYQWPLQGGELFMIQEQISNYLGVKSFKRKYPDLKRRPVEPEERAYLCDSGLVTESMCDLGLTAIWSVEVLDIMYQDFQDKYEDFRKHMREKQAKEMTNKQKAEKKKAEQGLSKVDSKEQAMQSAISWNQALNKARQEQRNCALDLQTWTIQFPQSKRSKMTKPMPKPGHYPLALIPGQYADYYRGYTPQELRYFPINTVLYGPMRPNEMHIMGGGSDGSQSESEDSSSSDDSSDTSSDDETEEDEREICKLCGNDKSKNCSHCNIGISNNLNKAIRLSR